MTLQQALHAALVGIDVNRPASSGICSRVEDTIADGYMGRAVKSLEMGFMAWPKFSGSIYYPVPGRWADGSEREACECFDMTSDENMWSELHPYGILRRELLEFLIEYFAEKINA